MAGVLAYNLAENDEKIKFDYSNSNSFQDSHKNIEDELEIQSKKTYENFEKVLTFANKKEYNEYNSSGYLISTIIKM